MVPPQKSRGQRKLWGMDAGRSDRESVNTAAHARGPNFETAWKLPFSFSMLRFASAPGGETHPRGEPIPRRKALGST